MADWTTSNFADFHLFHRDSAFGSAAIVPAAALDPLNSDAAAERLIAKHDPAPFLDLLALLTRAYAPAGSTQTRPFKHRRRSPETDIRSPA